jgi:DNA polymerase (family 10)
MHVVLPHARALADELARELIRSGARADVVGEVRLGHELIGELTLVCDRAASEVIGLLRAPDLSLARTNGGVIGTLALEHAAVPVRIHCTSARGYVEAVVRSSGAEEHILALESRARDRGTTLSDAANAATDEEAFYAGLDLQFLSPELRDSASLEAPALVEDVRGVFHVHTTWSDGVGSIALMARAAYERGFSYIGISDHSRAAHYANGLDVDRLLRQRLEVERARIEVPDITIFHGIECDILADGTLDLPDDVLAQLDFVVASVHSDLELTRDEQTRRVVRALDNPLVTILGHPTGRLLLGRPGIQIDIATVARAAAERGVFLEINTTGQRLDLCAEHARLAASLGASFAISPDAHEPRGFDMVPFGIILARRARLGPDQVMNTRDAAQMREFLAARRRYAATSLGLA